MGTGNCPCRGCTERMLMCHGRCERYQTWKTEYETGKEQFIMTHQRSDFPREMMRHLHMLIKRGSRAK